MDFYDLLTNAADILEKVGDVAVDDTHATYQEILTQEQAISNLAAEAKETDGYKNSVARIALFKQELKARFPDKQERVTQQFNNFIWKVTESMNAVELVANVVLHVPVLDDLIKESKEVQDA